MPGLFKIIFKFGEMHGIVIFLSLSTQGFKLITIIYVIHFSLFCGVGCLIYRVCNLALVWQDLRRPKVIHGYLGVLEALFLLVTSGKAESYAFLILELDTS